MPSRKPDGTRDRSRRNATDNPSTFENQNNATERRKALDWLSTHLRQVLVKNSICRHSQVGIVFVVEDGNVTGCQQVFNRTLLADALSAPMK